MVMKMKISKQDMLNYFKDNPTAFKEIQQQVQDKQNSLEGKRPYYAITKNELKQYLTQQAQAHNLQFVAISKNEFAFQNPTTKKQVKFCFANGKDYTIDPKNQDSLTNFQAKSWHRLDPDFLTHHVSDYFVFFISRRLDHRIWAITFRYPEILKMLQDKQNFYFGITKTNEIIEDRDNENHTYKREHLDLKLIFNDPRLQN